MYTCEWQEREKLKLLPAEEFHYLNQSSCFDLPGKESNAEEYVRTRRAMDIVGLSVEEQVRGEREREGGRAGWWQWRYGRESTEDWRLMGGRGPRAPWI